MLHRFGSDGVASSRIARALPYIVAAAVFAAFVFARGVPALRHDWLWPVDRAAYIQRMFDLTSGWSTAGMGYADPYPTPYPVIWPLLAIGAVFGSIPALVVLIAAIAGTLFYAGMRIARRFQAGALAGWAIGTFLLFNPWVYDKIVAGHQTMLLAYAGLALTVTELTEERPRFRRLAIALALSALQIQFFVLAFVASLLRIRSRSVVIALFTGIAVFSPTIVGLAWHTGALLGRLLTIDWEASQSVPLASGVLLLGYFPRYAEAAFTLAPRIGIALFVASALAAVFMWRARAAALTLCAIAVLLIVASGMTFIAAPLWRWAILHVPAVGLYREMYDLIGAVAVGYALLAGAAARAAAARYVLATAAALILSAWFILPPSRYWVSSASIPAVQIPVSVERYAIMPPFQPLTLDGSGDGIDPLYIGRSFGNAPLNALLPEYPADAALESYWKTGNASNLAALGVGAIVCRPHMQESTGAKLFYGTSVRHGCENGITPVQDAAPIVALVRNTPLCTLCNQIGASQEFFGDAHGAPGGAFARTLPQLRAGTDPKAGWIDARLAFSRYPALAQPFGGAYSEQHTTPLPIPHAPFMLADVIGTLRDARGQTLATTTRGYAWLRLPAGATSVSCWGRCTLALVGNPGTIPLNAPKEQAIAVQHRVITPWMWIASVPPETGGTLRVLQHYDRGWIALSENRVLPHVRLSGALDGWRVPRLDHAREVALLHVPSLVQLFCELLGYFAIGIAVIPKWRVD